MTLQFNFELPQQLPSIMQSGFTCLTCRMQLKRAINGKFLTFGFQSPPRRRWTSVVRHDAQRLSNSQPCIIRQQRRTVVSLRSRSQEQKLQDVAPESQRRSLSTSSLSKDEYQGPLLLQKDNLFHFLSHSPIPEMRRRGAYMKTNAYCPHPSHHQTHLPTASSRTNTGEVEASLPPAHVKFECPDCGIPVYCSEDHWAEDFENHIEICDTLRQINEDDHDLRSGRLFPEFEYPWPQMEEILPNMTNWDTYLYTREYEAINEERSLRHATKLLTYPMTIGSIIHELSPYNIRRGGRLTTEGLKSLSGK